MKRAFLVTSAIAFVIYPMAANAKGCIKGAAVGAVAGHVAGHHGKMGAAAGCAIGHHKASKAKAVKNAPKK